MKSRQSRQLSELSARAAKESGSSQNARPARKPAEPSLTLSVQRRLAAAERAGAPSRAQILRWARAAIVRDAEATVRLVGEAEARALNRDYRGRDYATNVLTFVYGEEDSPAGAPLTGDIVLCAPVIAREAAEQGKTLEAHYAHLIVHGMLHLQGYDHETGEADARRMEDRERAILAASGFADPYRDEDS
ncbi:MAG: rRNA maturation RNase YbeY [Candidatus Accumulibacter sp.]|jgi:probable rRNA maturation factor|nr:rRNA maturation RNase YbeY [Accumulibacter sp.]